jgi:hypothetical protein
MEDHGKEEVKGALLWGSMKTNEVNEGPDIL